MTDNRKVDFTALHCFFQVALTVPANGIPSVLNRLPFLPAPRNPIIRNMRKRVINFHLPLLNNTQSQSTQNAIADQLGLLTPQQQQYRRIDEQKKVNDCVMTLEKLIGPHRFPSCSSCVEWPENPTSTLFGKGSLVPKSHNRSPPFRRPSTIIRTS